MKSTTSVAFVCLAISPASFASQFLYNYTELGFYSGERGDFAAAVAGDKYSVAGLQASHVQKYQKWVAELGGIYGRNSLDVGTKEQSFTELGIEAAVGQYFPLGDSLEVSAVAGGNYLSVETLEFTSSDTYLFVRARASYALSDSLAFDLDYESRSGDTDQSVVAAYATWDNHKNLSAAVRHQTDLDREDGGSELLLRLAYQTAPDLKFYLQHRSASYDTGDTAIIELGARILLGQGSAAATSNSSSRSTPQERAEKRRKSAEEALRRDLPSKVR